MQLTYTDNGNGGLLAKLEPSIGLNVSYLNFDPDPKSSFEIGVGVLFGFLNNKVFVGWGRNLHVPQARDYFTLGFSFTNIVANITDSWELKKTPK